jgi:hypothetical protein
MVDIKVFRVVPGDKSLDIDLNVPVSVNTDGVVLDYIAIWSWDKYIDNISPAYVDTDPSTIPPDCLFITRVSDPAIAITSDTTYTNRIDLEAPYAADLSNDGMYFMIVKTKGGGGGIVNIPCGCDRIIDRAVAVTFTPIYDQALKLFRGTFDHCGKGRGELVDLYLKKQLLTDAIKYEDYPLAIELFGRYILMNERKRDCLRKCSSSRINSGCLPCTS